MKTLQFNILWNALVIIPTVIFNYYFLLNELFIYNSGMITLLQHMIISKI